VQHNGQEIVCGPISTRPDREYGIVGQKAENQKETKKVI